VFSITGLVYAVAAAHEDDGLDGSEHVLAADGTVAVGGAFDAAVRVSYGHGQADVATLCGHRSALGGKRARGRGSSRGETRRMSYLAVIKVFPESFPDPTYAAVFAVIYALGWIVIP
jgi:hypothetical protein